MNLDPWKKQRDEYRAKHGHIPTADLAPQGVSDAEVQPRREAPPARTNQG